MKDQPDLVKGFEKATRVNQIGALFESNDRKQAECHESVINAVQNGIDFLEMVFNNQS